MRAILILAVLAFAGAAHAAGDKTSSSKSGASNRYQAGWTLAAPSDPAADAQADMTTGDLLRQVEIPTVVAPVVVDGRLRNYAFVVVRLDVAEGHDPWAVRARAAYVRDAMLRAAHDQPLNDAGDAGGVNPETAARVWQAAANSVLGEGVVSRVRIVSTDMRHPGLAGGR